MFKECIKAQRNLHHLGWWNCLEKLAEIFLNTFHRISFSINDAVKSFRDKTVLKTLQLEFSKIITMIFQSKMHHSRIKDRILNFRN